MSFFPYPSSPIKRDAINWWLMTQRTSQKFILCIVDNHFLWRFFSFSFFLSFPFLSLHPAPFFFSSFYPPSFSLPFKAIENQKLATFAEIVAAIRLGMSKITKVNKGNYLDFLLFLILFLFFIFYPSLFLIFILSLLLFIDECVGILTAGNREKWAECWDILCQIDPGYYYYYYYYLCYFFIVHYCCYCCYSKLLTHQHLQSQQKTRNT